MNIYQHLFIILPSFILMYWGFYTKESTGTIVAALLGLVALTSYLGVVVAVQLVTLFKYLGTL